MKKLILALVLLFAPSIAWAQCSGAFPNNTVCGNLTGATNTPRSTPAGSIVASSYGVKQPVDVATTSNITLSGEQTIDGVLTSSSRVLVKDQSISSQNGIYVSAAGAWTRSTDFNVAGQVVQGTLVYVNLGTINNNTSYIVSSTNPVVPGSSSITFSFFGTGFQQTGTGAVVRRSEEKARERLSSADFNVVCDGVVDDTANLQKLFDESRDSGKDWYVQPGDCLVTAGVTIYTSGVMEGRLIAANSGQSWFPANITYLPADRTNIDVTTINAWTGLVRGNTKSVDFAPYYGKTVVLYTSSEHMINRRGDPVNQFNYRDVFVVTDPTSGEIDTPIMTTKTQTWLANETDAFAVTNRPVITITGLKVAFLTGSSTSAGAIYITRPNVTLISPSVFNESSGYLEQGILTNGTSGVTINGSYVQGVKDTSTNYSYHLSLSVGTTLLNSTEINSRRGVDAHGGKQITIFGGSYPDGIGAHWAQGITVMGAFVSSSPSNSGPFYYAGRDFIASGNTVYLQNDQYSVVQVRNDIYNGGGIMTFANNDVLIDASANLTTARTIFNTDPGASGTFDYGVQVQLPEQINITGNRIKQIGASFNEKLYMVNILGSGTLFASPSGMTAGGNMTITGNSYNLDAGNTIAGHPRVAVAVYKPIGWNAGTGYTIRVEDVSGVHLYAWADPTCVNSSIRSDFYTRNIGALYWQGGYNAFKTANLGRATQDNEFGTARPGSGCVTPVGDESEVAVDPQGGLYSITQSVASASTIDLGAVASTTNIRITGTTGITSFGTAKSGVVKSGFFQSALTLTHSATLLLNNGGSNITTAANDRFSALSLGSGTWLVNIYKAAGVPNGIVPISLGGTGVSLSATGGTAQVLKQESVGANITVGTLACADLSNDSAFCSGTDAVNLTGTIDSARLSGSYTGITAVGALTGLTLGAVNNLTWSGQTVISSPTDGKLLITNNAGNNFTYLKFGGTTNSFPAIVRSGAGLVARLADESANTTFGASTITASSGFVSGASAGQSATVTVRDSAGTGTCTLIFTGGLKTGGTC